MSHFKNIEINGLSSLVGYTYINDLINYNKFIKYFKLNYDMVDKNIIYGKIL